MAESPNIVNYSIPTGHALFTPTGGSEYDLGNIVNFAISNAITKKEHFTSRGGVRAKDVTRITTVAATIKFTLDEITAKNIAIFALGDVETNTDGDVIINGLSNTKFTGTLTIIGENDEGTQLDWTGDVSFTPSGDFNFIQDNDNYNTISVEADVQKGDNGFGVWTIREQDSV